MKIYIDADACPVKDETVRVAERHGVQVYIVSNGGLRPNPHSLVEMVTVAAGADEADKWIADQADVGDVVITGDIPLAARAIENGASALEWVGGVAKPAAEGLEADMAYELGADATKARWRRAKLR